MHKGVEENVVACAAGRRLSLSVASRAIALTLHEGLQTDPLHVRCYTVTVLHSNAMEPCKFFRSCSGTNRDEVFYENENFFAVCASWVS